MIALVNKYTVMGLDQPSYMLIRNHVNYSSCILIRVIEL
jgi:hypothetical protein